MRYIPALDGLRAVAILAVLFFHALPGTLKGGFTGVDVFFVLSGYLISSVILHDMRIGEFTIRGFYIRRIQRLFPNTICMILVTVALSYVVLLPWTAVRVAQHGLWALCNLSNVYIWLTAGGYWGDSANSLPLLHTWSLAVEEQFYLVFPIVLWILGRRSRTLILTVTSCLAVASFFLNVNGIRTNSAATFYLLPTRAWEPLLGAVVAICQMPTDVNQPQTVVKNAFALELAGWIGLATIVSGFFVITEGTDFPGWIALVPALGAVAVIVSIVDGNTRMARLLSKPFMVAIGKLSYSLYLWHWPLIVIGRKKAELTGDSEQLGTLIGAALGIVLSVIAYWCIEQPLRLHGRTQNWRPRLLITCVSFCATAGVLMVLLRSTDSRSVFDRPEYHAARYNVIGSERLSQAPLPSKFSDVILTPADPRPVDVWKTGGVIHDWGNSPPRLVVFGSSHACMFGTL
ncbi:MAG: acyltransferase-like protein, partial [Planctomycetaceae bacterium]|nr:acyltransferase-like protein [Planctomycetaceae bacterium]